MSQITERIMAEGDWSIDLAGAPDEILRLLVDNPFGEVYITDQRLPHGRDDIDTVRAHSTFTGVLLRVERDEITQGLRISGPSNAFWLGDSDGKGAVLKQNTVFDQEPLPNAVRTLLPDSVVEGSLQVPEDAPANWDGEHFLQTPREAITFIAEETQGEWRVNPDGSVDFGDHAQLGYITEPRALIVQRPGVPTDEIKAIHPTDLSSLMDVEDLVTEALVIGPGAGETIILGEGTAVNPYKDPFGNPLIQRGMFNEPILYVDHADDRASVLAEKNSQVRQQVTVGLDRFMVRRIRPE